MAKNSKNAQAELKKGKAQFMLIGEAKINDYTFKIDNEYDSGWVDNILNLGIDCGNGNIVYAELKGGYSTKNDSLLYVHGIKTDDNGKKSDDYENRFTIDWEDRFDENILETVGEGCFITVGIEKDTKGKTFTKKFLSGYDAVEYIQEHLTEGTVLNVKGNLSYSEYNDTVNVKKEISSIYLSKVDDPKDYKATFTQTILLDSSSIGKKDKEKNTIGINAYVVDYVGNIKIDDKKTKIAKNVVYPKVFELEVNENETITAKLLQKFFKVTKGTDMYELTVEGRIIEGQAIVAVTEDDIPDDIKELIEMGIYTQEEAEAKCAVGGGSREKRLVIVKPSITYVGEGENRKPTVAFDTTKYKDSDKVFLSQLLANLDSAKPNNEETEDEEETSEDDDLLAMLEGLE